MGRGMGGRCVGTHPSAPPRGSVRQGEDGADPSSRRGPLPAGGWWSLSLPVLRSVALPWTSRIPRALLGWWHPQLVLGAQGHPLTGQKRLAVPALVLQAGRDGQSEVPSLPRRCGACVVVDGSQAVFWQLPPLRAAGCKERSH